MTALTPPRPIEAKPLHELVASFTETVARPCLCGQVIIANPTDPTKAVQQHQATPQHAAWSERVYG